jgi:hypothetical protein
MSKLQSDNITSIVHCVPTIQKISLCNLSSDRPNKCIYRNIYGEYTCQNEIHKVSYCKIHNIECKKYSDSLIAMIENLVTLQRQNNANLSNYVDLYISLIDFIIKNKEIHVKYSLYKIIDTTRMKFHEGIESLSNRNIGPNWVGLCDFTLELNIKKMKEAAQKFSLVDIDNIVKNAQNELISNSIKIQKISEIRIKNTNNELLAPISKGIDSLIMSFITIPKPLKV